MSCGLKFHKLGWQTRLGKQDCWMEESILGGVAALLGRHKTAVGRCENFITSFAEIGKWEESFPAREAAANSHYSRHFPPRSFCSVHHCSFHGIFAAYCTEIVPQYVTIHISRQNEEAGTLTHFFDTIVGPSHSTNFISCMQI